MEMKNNFIVRFSQIETCHCEQDTWQINENSILGMTSAREVSSLQGESTFTDRQRSLSSEVPVECLDYAYIEKCNDVKYLEKILRVLR